MTDQPPPSDKQNRFEELLRMSLLGSEIIDAQFYLFSTRSDGSRVTRPRVLCANSAMLTNVSKYFSDVLSPAKSLSPSLVEITSDNQEIPKEACIVDYGYESDSDLEDDYSPPPIQRAPPSTLSTSGSLPEDLPLELEDDDDWREDRLDSVVSDVFTLKLEGDSKSDKAGFSDSKVIAHGSSHDAVLVDQAVLPLSTRNCRRFLVEDTAFQTWYALLYYFYTGKISFSPLKSARTRGGPSDTPKCSAKSMYRLANKVGHQGLRDEALKFLQENITEHNILTELKSSLLRRHPRLLKMELDVLYAHVASGPVVAGFLALARRIAKNELPHGADIVMGLHRRLIKPHPNSPLDLPSPVIMCQPGNPQGVPKGSGVKKCRC